MQFKIYAVGLNHTTAPIELRELFSCQLEEDPSELLALYSLPFVKEIVILSTCNRVEIYTVLKEANRKKIEELIKFFIKLKLQSTKNMESGEELFQKYFFIKEDEEAIEHILSVPSGLISMVLGETQIMNQFKKAFFIAQKNQTIGKILNYIYQRALRTAKRIRRETEISRTPVSVSYIALLLIKEIFPNLKDLKVLILGAGEIATLMARYLSREKAKLFVANRTIERAFSLAKELNANVVRWEEFKNSLLMMDIVISSTSAPHYIISKKDLEKVVKFKKKPLVFIDLAVPRNIDPQIREFSNIVLFNIDDLRKIAEENLKTRKKSAQRGFLIVKEETAKIVKWLENLENEEKIKELNEIISQLKEKSLVASSNKEEALNIFERKIKYVLFNVIKNYPFVVEEIIKLLRE